jgi:hypothetical protein
MSEELNHITGRPDNGSGIFWRTFRKGPELPCVCHSVGRKPDRAGYQRPVVRNHRADGETAAGAGEGEVPFAGAVNRYIIRRNQLP